jgi:hypothetical protein
MSRCVRKEWLGRWGYDLGLDGITLVFMYADEFEP